MKMTFAQLASGEVLSDLGKPTEALAALNRIPLHDFKPEVLETSFSIHLKAGNAGEAEKVANQLLELDGQYFKLFLRSRIRRSPRAISTKPL